MQGETCILISTCARYLRVADLTARQLALAWTPCPPVYFCGVDREGALCLRDDPSDWMSVTHSAVSDLLGRGFRWIYLVLDDHPPIGTCASVILNQCLPRWADELGATNIGLLGWGQRRAREGLDLGAGFAHLSRNDPSYRWKFSLHPALWSAEKLLRLLELRLKQFRRGERTPWNFERHRDPSDGLVPRELLESTFRVHGTSQLGSPGKMLVASKEIALWGTDGFRFLVRIFLGQQARDRFDRDGLWLYHIYAGPYPVFWSGVIRGGKPSPEFAFFFRVFARHWMVSDWSRLPILFPVK